MVMGCTKSLYNGSSNDVPDLTRQHKDTDPMPKGFPHDLIWHVCFRFQFDCAVRVLCVVVGDACRGAVGALWLCDWLLSDNCVVCAVLGCLLVG